MFSEGGAEMTTLEGAGDGQAFREAAENRVGQSGGKACHDRFR